MANNKLPYAIAKANGIDTSGMYPKEVWEILAKNGICVTYPQNTKYEDIIRAENNEEIEENEEQQEIEKKLLTKSNQNDIMHSYPKTNGFRNSRDLYNHRKHMNDFNLKTVAEYEEKAISFINNSQGEIFYSKSKERYYKYDENANTLAIFGLDSNIITFFKPKRGIQYFKDIKGEN